MTTQTTATHVVTFRNAEGGNHHDQLVVWPVGRKHDDELEGECLVLSVRASESEAPYVAALNVVGLALVGKDLQGDWLLRRLTAEDTEALLDTLNTYAGDNIWQDVILGSDLYHERATDQIDTGMNDAFATTLGSVIRCEPSTGRWEISRYGDADYLALDA